MYFELNKNLSLDVTLNYNEMSLITRFCSVLNGYVLDSYINGANVVIFRVSQKSTNTVFHVRFRIETDNEAPQMVKNWVNIYEVFDTDQKAHYPIKTAEKKIKAIREKAKKDFGENEIYVFDSIIR